MKVILDTNIVMSGIFWSGHARTILLLFEEGRFQHLCSKEIVEEYFATAEKLKNKLKREDRSFIDEILDLIVSVANC
jgi:predicted nucleic acid-binding protein